MLGIPEDGVTATPATADGGFAIASALAATAADEAGTAFLAHQSETVSPRAAFRIDAQVFARGGRFGLRLRFRLGFIRLGLGFRLRNLFLLDLGGLDFRFGRRRRRRLIRRFHHADLLHLLLGLHRLLEKLPEYKNQHGNQQDQGDADDQGQSLE